jgi:hypothetical protein
MNNNAKKTNTWTVVKHFQINPNYQDGMHPLESHFPLDSLQQNHVLFTVEI